MVRVMSSEDEEVATISLMSTSTHTTSMYHSTAYLPTAFVWVWNRLTKQEVSILCDVVIQHKARDIVLGMVPINISQGLFP